MEEATDLPVAKDTASECCRLGFCVESDFGQEANAFRHSLLKLLKQHFDRSNLEQKTLLVNGFIVLELVETPLTVEADDAWGDMAEEMLGGLMQHRLDHC